MSTWIIVWFFVATFSTLAVIVVLVALGRHALLVGRTAKKFQEEIAPLAKELGRQSARATERASALQTPKPKAKTRGNIGQG